MSNPEPHAIDAAIGKIVRLSVYTENLLQAFVYALIDDYERYTRILTAELPFSRLPALALSLYRERNGEDEFFEQVSDLLKRAEIANSTRNMLVHSEWFSAGSTLKATRLKSTARKKQGYKTKVENWTVDMFDEWANEFVAIREDGQKLLSLLISKGKAFNNPVYPNDTAT